MNILSQLANIELEGALRSFLEPAGHRVALCPSATKAPAILHPGATGAVFVQCTTIEAKTIAEVAGFLTAGYGNVFVFAENRTADTDERVLLAGARFVFDVPFRAALVLEILNRIGTVVTPNPSPVASRQIPPPSPHQIRRSPLADIRSVNRLLRNSKDVSWAPFFDWLRETLGLNRAVLYICEPTGDSMQCHYAAGVAREVTDHYPIPLLSGIGLLGQKHHIAFSTESLPANAAGQQARDQMNALGMSWAIPVSEAGDYMGLFLVGVKITGASLSLDDIELLFLLMEEVGGVLRERRELERLRNIK